MNADWGIERDDLRRKPPFFDEHSEDKPRPWRMLKRTLLALAVAPFILTVIYLVVPPVSTLMAARWITLKPVERQWVPLKAISPALPRAVIASEDGLFCTHHGVDWGAIRAVIEEADEDGPARGASTVSMQVAKNLFLWPGGGYIRKPIEIVIAHWIELVWPKSRVMEVYLNIVEWGPNGVFGAEASARRAFGKSAARLSAREAAIMVAALPNPVIRDPAKPSRGQIRRAATISRLGADASCLDS